MSLFTHFLVVRLVSDGGTSAGSISGRVWVALLTPKTVRRCVAARLHGVLRSWAFRGYAPARVAGVQLPRPGRVPLQFAAGQVGAGCYPPRMAQLTTRALVKRSAS